MYKSHSYNWLVIFISVLWLVSVTDVCSQFTHHNIIKISDPSDQLGNRFRAKNALIEDSKGILWIATGKGLCRYSGSTIDCLQHNPEDANSIAGNDIKFIMQDSEELIWTAIHERGVNVFDLDGRKVLELKYKPNTKQALLHDRVWGMWEDENKYIWISYFYGGLTRYDKEKDEYIHISIDTEDALEKNRPKTVVSIIGHTSEANTYWLATTAGLVKFNASTMEHQSFLFSKKVKRIMVETQYNKTVLEPNWCRSMCMDSKGDLWMGTFGALVKFNTETETSEVFRDIDGEIFGNVAGVFTYDKDHILVSSWLGISLLNIKNQSLKILADAKDANKIYLQNSRMYRTSDGCIYFLSVSGKRKGIYKMCPSIDFVEKRITNSMNISICATDNYVHYHRKPGQVESRHLKTGKIYTHPLEITNGTYIRAMAHYSGDTILIGDAYHLYKYHPVGGLKKIEALSIDNVSRHESIFVDSEGDIWNGRQRDGLDILKKKTKKVQHLDHTTDPSIVYQDYVVDQLEDTAGRIWIATEQGWSIYDKVTKRTRNYLSTDVVTESDFQLRTIAGFAQTDPRSIWIASTDNGVIQWNIAEERIENTISTKNGLRSVVIFDIESDKNDRIWLATKSGLSCIDPITKSVKNFGSEFGISGATYCISIRDGVIYGGRISSYYSCRIDDLLSFDKPSPAAYIYGFDLYDVRADTLLSAGEEIVLDHDENFFTFRYGSINYFNTDQEKYQYRLQGIDDGWVNDRGDRKKGYTNVPPGNYQFQLRVKTENADWSYPANVQLFIKPPWYETLWFRLLLLMVTILSTWWIITTYINRQKRKLEVDKRFAQLETMILKSQMNPHFIFNSLNSIRYLFMKDQKEKGIMYITKFAKLLRTTLNHGDEAVVPLAEEIELTEIFIQLEQLRFEDTFTYTAAFADDDDWKETMIPPFVIQPIVENAFWHGLLPSEDPQKRLDISIEKSQGGFLITIEDNGVGLHTAPEHQIDPTVNKSKSYGLSIIKERFQLINKTQNLDYTLSVGDTTNYKTGTLVQVEIKNKNNDPSTHN